MFAVLLTKFKSNKAPTFQIIAVDNFDEVKSRVDTIMNSSADVNEVEVYEYVSHATKVETVQWA